MNEEIMFGVYWFLFLVFFMLVGIPVLMFLSALYNTLTGKASKLTFNAKKRSQFDKYNNQEEPIQDLDQDIDEEPDESLVYDDLFGE